MFEGEVGLEVDGRGETVAVDNSEPTAARTTWEGPGLVSARRKVADLTWVSRLGLVVRLVSFKNCDLWTLSRDFALRCTNQ